MKTRIRLLISVIAFFLLSAEAPTREQKAKFKIIGYYSLPSAMTVDPKSVPFTKLTHINLWFLNPDTLGNFTEDFSALAPFIEEAHRNQVKVLASIGGGTKHPYYARLLKEENREMFVDQLLSVVLRYNLDGIDVDLEGSDIDEHYESFAVDLARSLKSHQKLITAAIAIFYKDALTDKALAQYDFVNIMSYDHTGPWNPEKPGPHSTYAHAVEALAYFGKTRAIPKEKMTLGVPFYGYGYGPALTSPAVSMNYGEISSAFPGSESVDQWDMPGGKTMYYNGINTIKQKTALAKKKASGVMIWQVQGDAPAPNSLLDAINAVAYGKK